MSFPTTIDLRSEPVGPPLAGAVQNLQWSADGRWLAASSSRGVTIIVDRDGSATLQLPSRGPGVPEIAWSRRGAEIAVVSPRAELATLCLATGRTGELILPGPARALAWIAGDSRLAVATGDHVLVADPRQGALHERGVLPAGAAAFDVGPGVDVMAVVGSAGARLHDLTPDGDDLPLAPSDPLVSCAFSPDGELIAAGHRLGAVSIWDLAAASEPVTLASSPHGPEALAWRHDGARLATAGGSDVVVWALAGRRVDTDAPLFAVRSTSPVTDVAYQPGGQLLALVEADGTLALWAPDDGRLRARVDLTCSPLVCAWHPAADCLAVGTLDGTVTIVELA